MAGAAVLEFRKGKEQEHDKGNVVIIAIGSGACGLSGHLGNPGLSFVRAALCERCAGGPC